MNGIDADRKSVDSYARCPMNESMSRRNTKADDILRLKEVSKWYNQMMRRSQESARVRLNNLANFCKATSAMPLELVQMKEAELFRIVSEYIECEEERKLLGSSIAKKVDSVRSWVRSQGKELRQIQILGAKENPTIDDLLVPNQDELRQLLLAAPSLRTRCLILLMAHSGLRPSAIGRDKGKNGLRFGDLPDLDFSGKPRFTSVPAQVAVPRLLSKNRKPYVTFLSSECVEHVEAYLAQRANSGEQFTNNTPLICSNGRNDFLYPTKIGSLIKGVIDIVGLKMRPYELRHFFSTQIQIAEGRVVGMSRSMVRSWMGHKDVTAGYGLGRGALRRKIIDEMRVIYADCEPFLLTDTNKKTSSLKSKIDELLTQLGMPTTSATNGQKMQQSNSNHVQTTITQKVVTSDQVEEHLSRGYQFVGTLPDSSVILKIPHD